MKLCSDKYIKLGRGAHNQHSSFHQAFLDEKDRLQQLYVHVKTHREKRRIQEQLIAWVHRKNGKFVEECEIGKKGTIREVTDQKRLLAKVSQALREPRKQKYKEVSPRPVVPPERSQYVSFVEMNDSRLYEVPPSLVTSQAFDKSTRLHWIQNFEPQLPTEYHSDSTLDHPFDRVPLMSSIHDDFLYHLKESDPFWIRCADFVKDDWASRDTNSLCDQDDFEHFVRTEFDL
jgi:hypothetical protein